MDTGKNTGTGATAGAKPKVKLRTGLTPQESPMVAKTPPALPVEPVRKLMGWMITLFSLLVVVGIVNLAPKVLHSVQVLAPTENETVAALAHCANPEQQHATVRAPGGFDLRSREERDYDIQARRHVMFGAPEVWAPLMTQRDVDKLRTAESAMSPEASRFAFQCSMVFGGLESAGSLGAMAGTALMILLLCRMVNNASILYPERSHAKPSQIVIAFFIPVYNLIKLPLEMWRAWRGVAETDGRKASGLVAGLWWGAFALMGLIAIATFIPVMENYILPHWWILALFLSQLVYHIASVFLLVHMRRTVKA